MLFSNPGRAAARSHAFPLGSPDRYHPGNSANWAEGIGFRLKSMPRLPLWLAVSLICIAANTA